MPSNDPRVLQKVRLMKHCAIYDKHTTVLFQNVLWLQCASLREMTDTLRNTISVIHHDPNKATEAQGKLHLRIHVTLMLNIIFLRESK